MAEQRKLEGPRAGRNRHQQLESNPAVLRNVVACKETPPQAAHGDTNHTVDFLDRVKLHEPVTFHAPFPQLMSERVGELRVPLLVRQNLVDIRPKR